MMLVIRIAFKKAKESFVKEQAESGKVKSMKELMKL